MGNEDQPPHGIHSPGDHLYIYGGTQRHINANGAISHDSGDSYTAWGSQGLNCANIAWCKPGRIRIITNRFRYFLFR